MNYEAFISSLSRTEPPAEVSAYLQAMWYDWKNDWESSHNIAQDIPDANGSWIHAYLHRKEGDFSNAAYWYLKAGKPIPTVSLTEEWKLMVENFLENL